LCLFHPLLHLKHLQAFGVTLLMWCAVERSELVPNTNLMEPLNVLAERIPRIVTFIAGLACELGAFPPPPKPP
jgi:hypothetical protein